MIMYGYNKNIFIIFDDILRFVKSLVLVQPITDVLIIERNYCNIWSNSNILTENEQQQNKV